MLTLPDVIVSILIPFATLFTNPTWRKAQVLLFGAILTPGQRTVAAALRVMGRSDHLDYARYHEVLNRAVWSPRAEAGCLHLVQGVCGRESLLLATIVFDRLSTRQCSNTANMVLMLEQPAPPPQPPPDHRR